MPRIGRFPVFGKRFFRLARKIIGCCHFAHFWRVVTAIAAMHGLLSNPSINPSENWATAAVSHADDLIEELAKQEETNG